MSGSRGFTIVDVLALSAAAIGTLAATQPVLESNKAQSMGMSNLAQHQRLAARQGLFMLANDGQFPGANVTGWIDVPGPAQDDALFAGNRSSGTPTQTTDWITPLLGEELGWSANRALRTQQMLDQVRDPRNGRLNDTLFGTSSDVDEYIGALQNGGYFSTSYLAPAAFHYWGTPNPGGLVPGKGTVPPETTEWFQKFGGVPYNWSGGVASNIKTPRGYRPRVDMVGPSLAQKVMFADGTRFVDASGIVDIDLDPTPTNLGNFTSGFFAFDGETSYGRTRPGINFSARRQGLGQGVDSRILFITYLDGSTRTSTVAQAKARPDWWAPTGSEWVSLENIAPEAAAQYEVGDLLP